MHVMLHLLLLLTMVSVLIQHIIIPVVKDNKISTIPHTYYNNLVLPLSVVDLAVEVSGGNQEEEVVAEEEDTEEEEEEEYKVEEEEESGTLIVLVD